MRALRAKLYRDLRHALGTLLSVIVIIAIGAGAFITLGTAQRILESSRDAYYRDYRFADFWIDVKKAPLTAVDELRTWPEIAALESRVVFDVIIDVAAEPRPLSGRLIAVPERGWRDTLNALHLVRGSGFSPARDNEVIISEAFATAHQLQVGDRVRLVLNRKIESFVIVGTALSPEYIYMVRGAGDLIPDAKRFGTLYVKERFAREILGFKDACNQIVGQIVPAASGQVDSVLERADRALEPYGVLELTPRRRQPSHRFLSDELNGLRVMSRIMPTVFLTVAALVLNLVMMRLADRQRTIIGTLKALGYSNRKILRHYLGFGVVVGVLGGVGGIVIGNSLAYGMIQLYKRFFQFPRFEFRVAPDLMLIGVAISVGFALLGALRGVHAVLKLHPAEAMRAKPPERGGAIGLERVTWLWRRLGFRTHMALRAVFRNRGRSLTTVLANALAGAIMFLAFSMWGSFFRIVDYQFNEVLRSDVDIGLREEAPLAALFEARQLPGVTQAEPLLGVRCDLRNGLFTRRVAITGLAENHALTVPRLARGGRLPIPADGLVMSEKLANLLNVRAGDEVELTPVRGQRRTRRVRIAALADTYIGLDVYADLAYLSRIVGEAMALNAVQLAVDPAQRTALYEELKELPSGQGLSVRADSRRNIEDTLIKTSTFSIGLMVLFACVIAFGGTVNNVLIELGDREREVATFRVLGYRPAQIAVIFVRQSVLLFAAGLVLALPLGYLLFRLLILSMDTELFRLPTDFQPVAAVRMFLVATAAIAAAQIVVFRQIRRLDYLEGIKVKE